MAKRLVLLSDEEADFIEAAIDTWRAVNAGDHSEAKYGERGYGFNVKRYLHHKYTKAEIEEIAALVLEMME